MVAERRALLCRGSVVPRREAEQCSALRVPFRLVTAWQKKTTDKPRF